MFSAKDKKPFEILQRYRKVDNFSQHIKSFDIYGVDKDKGLDKKEIKIIVTFDNSLEKNYGEVLSKFERYKKAITEEFKDMSVKLDGLPKEDTIAVDFEKDEKDTNKTQDITITIGELQK
jgi:hypothetical protein